MNKMTWVIALALIFVAQFAKADFGKASCEISYKRGNGELVRPTSSNSSGVVEIPSSGNASLLLTADLVVFAQVIADRHGNLSFSMRTLDGPLIRSTSYVSGSLRYQIDHPGSEQAIEIIMISCTSLPNLQQ